MFTLPGIKGEARRALAVCLQTAAAKRLLAIADRPASGCPRGFSAFEGKRLPANT